MGNGIPFLSICCTKNERNIKDIDINRINSKIPIIRENHSPTKETQKENSHEILMKSETKKSKYNKNDNITFKKRNFTHKNYKRNSPLIHVTTLKNIKHNQLISFSNINGMNIFRNSTNKRHYNSYFNSQLGKFGTNNISSFNFSSGVKDHFCEIFKNINSKLKLSGQLFNNKTLILDKYGLEHSHKKEFNGVASFGFTNSGIALSLYDYVFDKDIFDKINKNKNKKYSHCKIFDILLDKKEKIYVLFYMHNSFLLYYKIKQKINLDFDKDYYFLFKKTFLSVNIRNGRKLKIHIEVKTENEKNKYTFEIKDLPIKIGREDCSINIPNQSISKIHSYIECEKGAFWYKNENSKNGSTLILKEEDYIKIKGKMRFKLEGIPFTIEEIDGNKEENNNLINIVNKEDEEDEEED